MIKEFTNKIPPNETIAIYGAGIAGLEIKKHLEENRPDVKIKFFVDAIKSGMIDGLEINSAKELETLKNEFNLLVVATNQGNYEYDVIFKYLGINFIRISRQLEYFSQIKVDEKKYLMAKEIFFDEQDKELYEVVWNARKYADYTQIEQYALKNYGISKMTHYRALFSQYLDKINKDAIKTVIDGGFCNGINAIAFDIEIKNLEKIYAFEPMYENFKNEIYANIIGKIGKIEIIHRGLWEKEEVLEFCKTGTNTRASHIKEIKAGRPPRNNDDYFSIKTMSIDELVKQKNNPKIDFIKMDIEGAELKALKGGTKTLKEHRPQLAVSIYHSNEDFVDIPIYLNEVLENYTFRVGHYSPDTYETLLYAIPNELA